MGSENPVGELKQRLEAVVAGRLDARAEVVVAEALAAAEHAHAGQQRDDGSPYIQHPLRVALILAEELGFFDPQLLATALLHDVLEDAPHTGAENLRARFGEQIADLVWALTKPPRRGLKRAEHTAQYYAVLAESSDAARIVKLADKLDNARDALSSWPSKRSLTACESCQLLSRLCPLLEDQQVAARFRALFAPALVALEASSS